MAKIRSNVKSAATRHGRVVLFLWIAQLLALGWFFAELTWDKYWLVRGLYRPGLKLFEYLANDILPGHFFSWYSRTGVITGFAFASLAYALIAYIAVRLIQATGSSRR